MLVAPVEEGSKGGEVAGSGGDGLAVEGGQVGAQKSGGEGFGLLSHEPAEAEEVGPVVLDGVSRTSGALDIPEEVVDQGEQLFHDTATDESRLGGGSERKRGLPGHFSAIIEYND